MTNFTRDIREEGHFLLKNAISQTQVVSLRAALEAAIRQEKAQDIVLCCLTHNRAFAEIFDNKLIVDRYNEVLGDGCIVYSYSSSSVPPHSSNTSGHIHVDCARLIPGYVTNLLSLILLDDFTEENGATYFLPRSHNRLEKPGENEFYLYAKRLTGKAGDVWFFNPRLWHAAGVNYTDSWRHALAITMCRSWMKQRLDIPRMISPNGLSKTMQQKLGFFAQVPASYEEYYQRTKFSQETE